MLRRFGAALSALLLLQILQPGRASQCASGGAMDRAGTHVERAATGRSSSVQSASRSAATMVAHGGDAATQDSSHRGPRGGGQCASAATCGVIVAARSATLAELGSTRGALELPDPPALHSTFSDAPDLPPPRA